MAIEIGQWNQPGRIARPAAAQHVVGPPSAPDPRRAGWRTSPTQTGPAPGQLVECQIKLRRLAGEYQTLQAMMAACQREAAELRRQLAEIEQAAQFREALFAGFAQID